jgi:hypothetical protein
MHPDTRARRAALASPLPRPHFGSIAVGNLSMPRPALLMPTAGRGAADRHIGRIDNLCPWGKNMIERAPAMPEGDPSVLRAPNDYYLCGWRVRSAMPIPEAMPWVGNDRAPDVRIRLGTAPALIDPVLTGPMQVGRDGTCRLEIDEIGRFLVIGGQEVIIEPCGDVGAPEFQTWLLGTVMGMLCHQRGRFPLHAACVRVDGGAVALTGPPGSGKSTLAAALVRRGHGLLADDVCVIAPQARGGPLIVPSFPRLRLNEDTMEALAIPAEGMPRSGSGKRKFHFCEFGKFDPNPARLRAIYHVNRFSRGWTPDIERRTGADAVVILAHEIYRRSVGFKLGRKRMLLADALRIAAAAPVFHLPIPGDLDGLGATAARIEAHVATLALASEQK